MKSLKRIVVIFFIFVFLSACGNKDNGEVKENEGNARPQINIKLGHAMSEGTNATTLIHEFTLSVKEKTDGRVVIEDFPNSQLGSETDMLEQIQLGSLDSGVIMTGSMQAIDQKLAIEDLPYMWKDLNHARNAYDGKFGDFLGDIIGQYGMKKIGFIEWGYREITNNSKPIVKPEDLKGVKIRVAQNKLRVDAFEKVGALPTMLAFSELYGALQQKVVDAQENPLSNIVASNFNEVQKYLSITDHFYNQAMVVINRSVWDTISEEDQNIILECMKELSENVKRANDNDNAQYIETLKSKGMEINDDVDKDAFRNAMLSVYKDWEPIFGADLMKVYNEASGW
ncbi:DctP family TRAP transporter solute-binding subunit [Peptoniphilus raoultii]|uniref:DctP family TRAP transporter solute-binding subunit n=1 Tax=Peptoniphilus raoultii TaxID=1776387 RepID=UPI0008DA3C0E|nr:DctP family TRAP transporter solute-binding subunit [Peptoniphilus raoultii]